MRDRGILVHKIIIFFILVFFTVSLPHLSFSEAMKKCKPVAMGVSGNEKKNGTHEETPESKTILIRFGHRHFNPLQEPSTPSRKHPAGTAIVKSIKAYPIGTIGYYIVQFDGPVKNSWKKALRDTGANIFDYIPDFAFIIRMNSEKEDAVRTLPHVRWLGIYQPEYKLSQRASDKIFSSGTEKEKVETRSVLLHITIFPGENPSRITFAMSSLGCVILDVVTTKWKTTIKANVPAARISDVSLISGVKWIEPAPRRKLFNNESTDIMHVRTPRNTHGLYGEGQTVGVCDTGLDQGSTEPLYLHNDFEDGSGNTRVIRIFDLAGDGPEDTDGHGTHVAGSVLGNGMKSGSDPSSNDFPSTCFAGIAPKARLIFQAAGNNSSGALYIPSDLNVLFQQADNAGADLHTNSWGGEHESGFYDTQSQEVDQYMWDHRDFLILFAAGNEGTDMDRDGVVDLYSMSPPGTAKNCLTVGASEGNRPSGEGYDYDWGDLWPTDFSEDPIFSDHVSDESDGMAPFSSRGPILDGRYKPDIVAPGTNIVSVRSSLATDDGWGIYDSSYLYEGGTSMSTPLTAGAATLMREYLIKEEGFPNPSAALIKAALLNSADDISPGQYGAGATQEIPDSPTPNNVEGWGRLNLANAVHPASPFNIVHYDEQDSLSTSESHEYLINVSDQGNPMKINLVWTDYPGTPQAQGGLVNDLDLRVTDPSLGTHYPDNASQKSSLSMLSYDSDASEDVSSANRIAIRFTPPSYPSNVESTTFYFANNPGDPDDPVEADVDVVVYDDDGVGGLPGMELFRKTLGYVPTGYITIGITGVVVNTGDFYVALEKTSADVGVYYTDDSNPTGRSYIHNGSEWTLSSYTASIYANVRGTVYGTSFDRVNNVVGMRLDNPDSGIYTVRVSGYNVPQGSQPYALIISGSLESRSLQFGSATYTVDENGGTATITVTRTGGTDGAVSVEYETSNGTATADSDYEATGGTLTWSDGESGPNTFTVTINDDSDAEGDETVNLTLSNPDPDGQISLGRPKTAVLVIQSNDSDGQGGGGGNCFIQTAISVK